MAGVANPLTTHLGEAEVFTLKYDKQTTTDIFRGGNHKEPKVKELRLWSPKTPNYDFKIDEDGYIKLDPYSGKTEIFKCEKGTTF